MNDQHLTTEQLERFAKNEMDGRELAEADLHISICEACCDKYARACLRLENDADREKTRSIIETAIRRADSEVGIDGHLTYAQIMLYSDRSLDRRESRWVEEHIAECQECREEISEYRAETASPVLTEASLKPASSAKPAAPLSPAPARPIPSGLVALLDRLKWRYTAQFSFAAAAVLIIACLFLVNRLFAQRGELIRDNRLSQQQIAEIARVSREASQLKLKLKSYASNPGQTPMPTEIVKPLLAADLWDLTSDAGELRGPGNTPRISLVSPVGRLITNPRPTFRWTAPADAASHGYKYKIDVIDDRNDSRIDGDQGLLATSWKPKLPLPVMRPLEWQVQDGVPSQTAPYGRQHARFMIVDKDRLRQTANSLVVASQGLLQLGRRAEAKSMLGVALQLDPTNRRASADLAAIITSETRDQ